MDGNVVISATAAVARTAVAAASAVLAAVVSDSLLSPTLSRSKHGVLLLKEQFSLLLALLLSLSRFSIRSIARTFARSLTLYNVRDRNGILSPCRSSL